MDQIANMLNSRQLGALPSDIERNLREHVKAITLRNGKELNALESQKKNHEEKVGKKEWIEEKSSAKNEVVPGRILFPDNPPPYVPPVPYPQRLAKAKLDK